jgi:hypothetical protein
MIFPSLPSRNLEPAELRALVDALAEDPESWHLHVGSDPVERQYASLYRDDYVDVWVIVWRAVGDTGWHDHDISSGAVRVIEGELRESNPRMGGVPVDRVIAAGTGFSFGPEHIHRLTGHAEHSISIHAYSPPLWRLGQYSIDADGVMRRVSVSYAEELRPPEESVAA